LTATSFIPRQNSWDYRHEHEHRKEYAASPLPNILKRPTHAFQIFSPNIYKKPVYMIKEK